MFIFSNSSRTEFLRTGFFKLRLQDDTCSGAFGSSWPDQPTGPTPPSETQGETTATQGGYIAI